MKSREVLNLKQTVNIKLNKDGGTDNSKWNKLKSLIKAIDITDG